MEDIEVGFKNIITNGVTGVVYLLLLRIIGIDRNGIITDDKFIIT